MTFLNSVDDYRISLDATELSIDEIDQVDGGVAPVVVGLYILGALVLSEIAHHHL